VRAGSAAMAVIAVWQVMAVTAPMATASIPMAVWAVTAVPPALVAPGASVVFPGRAARVVAAGLRVSVVRGLPVR
jgi:hypothetical protein